LLLGAMGLYLQKSRPLTTGGRYSTPVFCLAIFLMQAGMLFSPPPPSDRAMAATALIAYAVLAALIAWIEGGRATGEGTHGGYGTAARSTAAAPPTTGRRSDV
jgi:hypothetical protein